MQEPLVSRAVASNVSGSNWDSPYLSGNSPDTLCFWPNNGKLLVSLSVALAGIRLAEEATLTRLPFMCEIDVESQWHFDEMKDEFYTITMAVHWVRLWRRCSWFLTILIVFFLISSLIVILILDKLVECFLITLLYLKSLVLAHLKNSWFVSRLPDTTLATWLIPCM